MKIDRLVGDRYKERPSDCVIDSHALMIRGGYIKYVASGIYSSYTPLRRIAGKIERIIREEMDAIDGQEVLFPVVLPGSLWDESGRSQSVGSELVRFKDRNGSSLVLGMTHEEAAVQLVREYGQSYAKYPFMIYQIQTKFRDEARPRGGLIRVREFTMKDAYSFHTSQEDLERYYERCYQAYKKIFARVGLPDVLAVSSDSGIMGGNISHEFILPTPVGEDSIAVCKNCDYHANTEAAESVVQNDRTEISKGLGLVHTPEMHTIDEVCKFLNIPYERSCKAVVYQKNTDDKHVIIFIRGDLDVNETKLTNYLGSEIHPAVISDNSGINAGYIGPYDLNGDLEVLFDRSLEGASDLVCGANIADYHFTGLNIERDCGDAAYIDFAKIKEDGICPKCGSSSINILRGIEVGNIFQLGTKYTKAMDMHYLDRDGAAQHPVMGCYGIGIGRLAASVCEMHHDDNGPIWPISIAPWQVHLCAIRSDDAEVKTCADVLYREMQRKGIEVIYDDRNTSAGVIFSDADLLGAPIRVIVSPRSMKSSCCEIATRDKKINIMVPAAEAARAVEELIIKLSDKLSL